MSVLIKNEKQRLTVESKVAKRLNEIDNEIAALQDEENSLRHQILEEMQANNIDRCKSEGLIFTQVFPKDKVEFNQEKFVNEADDDIIMSFSQIEETKEFNLEKFMSENPELYNKYVETKTNLIVDTKALQKALPIVFDRYTTVIPNEKPSTLRITADKKGE